MRADFKLKIKKKLAFVCFLLLLLKRLELLAELGDGVAVLLAKCAELRFVIKVRFLLVTAQLGELVFASLIDLDLRCGRTAGFIKALRELLEVMGALFVRGRQPTNLQFALRLLT